MSFKRWPAFVQVRAARGWQEDILLSCSCEGSVLDSQCALSTLPAGTICCLAFQASGSTEDAGRAPIFDEAQPQHGDWVRVATHGGACALPAQAHASIMG